MTEQELVEGCIREDRICQRELWNRYSKKIMSLCLRYCNSQEEAEDALMEAYVKIYDNLAKFRFQSSLAFARILGPSWLQLQRLPS